jgi:hypothetical protein
MSITLSEASEEADVENSRRCNQVVFIIASLYAAIEYYSTPFFNKMEYHTSALTGQACVLELLNGHPDRICCELGVCHHVFYALIDRLRAMGHSDAREVMLEEQLAIFLYTCVTGLTICHVGEHFQHANGTISRCAFSKYSLIYF